MAAVEALPGASGLLTLTDGSQVTVSAADCPVLWPVDYDGRRLSLRWDQPEQAVNYRVLAHLEGRAAWALGCRPTTATLTAVYPAPDIVTFESYQHGAETPDFVTAPRGALVRLGIPLPRLEGMPVQLTVTDQEDGADFRDAPPCRVFFFDVYPETPEGAACLEALGLSERVGLPDGEE